MENAGFLGDVGERAIAVVVIKRICAWLKATRPAHYVDPLPLAPASLPRPRHRVVTEVHVTHHENIYFAVAVVIHKTATRAPLVLRGLESGLGRHIGKRPVPVVVIQHILSPIGDQQIEIAVIVVVADAPALCPAWARQPGPRCNVGKGPVVVVVIQVAGRSFVFRESFYRRTVGQKNVGPAVVIVIENDGPVAGGFNDEFLVSVAAVYVERAQSRLRGNVFEVDFARLDSRRRRFGRLGGLGCKPAGQS